MISFVKMEWQWLGHNVAKENLWTSVTLACIALLVEFSIFIDMYLKVRPKKSMLWLFLHFTLIHRLLQTYLTEKLCKTIVGQDI